MIIRLKTIIMATLIIVIMATPIFASWTGPQEVLSGTWGNGQAQFYFESGDTEDIFPRQLSVDKNGNVIIADEGNARIVIYDLSGKLIKILQKPAQLPAADNLFGWPSGLSVYSGGNSLTVTCQYQQDQEGAQPSKECFLDYDGNILAKADLAEVFPIDTGYVLLNYKTSTYGIYTPTGQLIKTSTTKPPELGIVKSQRIADKQYKVTVTYPDQSMVIHRNIGAAPPYIRDVNGNLNGFRQPALFAGISAARK